MLSAIAAARAAARRVPVAALAPAAAAQGAAVPTSHMVAAVVAAGAAAAFGTAASADHASPVAAAGVPTQAAPLDLSTVTPIDDELVYGKPKVLFVLGGPGAGKGTQCGMMVEQYGFTHLSAGDLLRAERNDPSSADGEMINEYIKEGNIVPVEVTLRLIAKAMKADGNTKFLIDGFPRSYDNMQGWQKHMDPITNVLGVLFYDTDEEVMTKRILGRAATSGRKDDNAITIRKRFKVFKTQTMPVVEHYAHRGQVFVVDSSAPVEEVFAASTTIVAPIVQREVLQASAHLAAATAHAVAPVIARLARGEAAQIAAAEAVTGNTLFLSAPTVTLTGPNLATVSHNRKVVPAGASPTDVTRITVGSEVRTWEREAGKWVCTGVSRGDALAGADSHAEVQWLQV